MPSELSSLKWVYQYIVPSVVFVLLCSASATDSAPLPRRPSNDPWQGAMLHHQFSESGCYSANYPNDWTKVSCRTITPKPLSPSVSSRKSHLLPAGGGSGNDWSIQPTGLISTAYATFKDARNLNSEEDVGKKGTFANQYSLQMNSNNGFDTPGCEGASGCTGWQQFVYQQCFEVNTDCGDGSGKAWALIQYWLLDYGSFFCPSGFTFYLDGRGRLDCFMNSPAVDISLQNITELKHQRFAATANALLDQVVFVTPTQAFASVNSDSILDLSAHWNVAEYNVLGFCCGSEAHFNPGAELDVLMKLDANPNGNSDDYCYAYSTTAETNNLGLGLCVGAKVWEHGRHPSIQFFESQ